MTNPARQGELAGRADAERQSGPKTFVDQIVADCPDFDVSIQRYDDGDICIYWRRASLVQAGASITVVARRTGLDEDLFGETHRQGPDGNRPYVYLHVPKDVAGREL